MEAVLEPDLPIVDAHHHLWHLPNSRYLFDELAADAGSGHAVRATVFIEAGAMYRADGPPELRSLGETEFANGVAAMGASGRYGDWRPCAAIVGNVDLALGDAVEPVLDAHVAAGGGRFRGVRHRAYWDAAAEVREQFMARPPEGVYRDPDFRRGFARLIARGLSLDAILLHPQLPDLIDLARSHPEAPIVLNHMGFPLGIGPYAGQRDAVFAAWKASMAELARYPGVTVKLGGTGMPIWGFDFHRTPASSAAIAEAWRPYVETCIALFGPTRCMMESNFPVDRVSCDYRTLWNAMKRITAGLDAAAKTALYSGTAARVYRIAQ